MRQTMASLIAAHTKRDGVFDTTVPNLYLYRHSSPSVSIQGVLTPTLGVIAQGRKQLMLRGEAHTYDAATYVVIALDLPVTGNVTLATRSKPYLGIRYDLDISQVASLAMEGKMPEVSKRVSRRGIFVSSMTEDLEDAVLRMMSLLDRPEDINVMSPLLQREILYRLLRGEQGWILRRIAQEESQTRRIMRAVTWLKQNFDQPFSLSTLAHEAGMSPSGLLEHFRRLTNMSPLQYQKQLRLQEARRLLFAKSMDATTVAYQVGYASASQFSREYGREFGRPPIKDIEHLRKQSQLACP